jgi:hypothetical protein
VEKLVGEVAEKVDPRTRAMMLAQKLPQQGGGKSTGANAQRKRAQRSAGGNDGEGRGRGGRGTASGQPQSRTGDAGRRGARQDVAPRSHGAHSSAAGSARDGGVNRNEGGQRSSSAPRSAQRPATGQRPAAPRSSRRASAPATQERRRSR